MKKLFFLFLFFGANVCLFAQSKPISVRFLFAEKKDAIELPYSFYVKEEKKTASITCEGFVFTEKILFSQETTSISLGNTSQNINFPRNTSEILILVFHEQDKEQYMLLNDSIASFPVQNIRLINLSEQSIVAQVKERKIALAPRTQVKISIREKCSLSFSVQKGDKMIQGFQQQFYVDENERMSLIIRNPKINNSPRLQVFKLKEYFSEEEK